MAIITYYDLPSPYRRQFDFFLSEYKDRPDFEEQDVRPFISDFLNLYTDRVEYYERIGEERFRSKCIAAINHGSTPMAKQLHRWLGGQVSPPVQGAKKPFNEIILWRVLKAEDVGQLPMPGNPEYRRTSKRPRNPELLRTIEQLVRDHPEIVKIKKPGKRAKYSEDLKDRLAAQYGASTRTVQRWLDEVKPPIPDELVKKPLRFKRPT